MKIIADNGFGVYEVPPKLMAELRSSFTSLHYSSVINLHLMSMACLEALKEKDKKTVHNPKPIAERIQH
ncbi:MAG: hypothetical protein HF976_13380 [ANME-2 cluster archaeon]|nr:hypothetical protein [ANME-2 cluster archaeon]MBC2702369.1 hypothetical protein [ANME-2 cluster archaeon]MBC2708464.1 hypothetical protein [ANME-2 cluster archaeon]